MILIGQYDSPFVRRVAVAMSLYAMPFEHRAWSVFADQDRLRPLNPLRRVPTLVLDDGEVLTESFCILDALDDMVEDDVVLVARRGVDRRRALKTCALAVGLADKAVSLVYERAIHDRATPMWVERCCGQIRDVLDALEAQRLSSPARWWFGDRLNHADIAVGAALGFLTDAHPSLFALSAWPKLQAHVAACEALPAFATHKQAFKISPPKAAV